jgi:hypothetical protein
LGVVCHCFPPPLDVPTFAARCLYVRNDARYPSSERWICGREMCPVILPKFRLPRKFRDLLCILLGISAASDCCMPTFRNTICFIFIGWIWSILHTLYPAYEYGTDRVFRNVGIQQSDAGEIPKRIQTRFKTRRKFEIKKFRDFYVPQIYIYLYIHTIMNAGILQLVAIYYIQLHVSALYVGHRQVVQRTY